MSSTTQIVYILRGPSGCGKSFRAKEIIAGTNGKILTTDDFFLNPVTGKYDWNTSSLPKAHYWNQTRCRVMMEEQISPLVIDNTNLEPWEAKPYVLLAEEFGYSVEIMDIDTPWKNDAKELSKRTSHQIPLGVLQTMVDRLKPYNLTDVMRSDAPEINLAQKEKKKIETNFRARYEQEKNPQNENSNKEEEDTGITQGQSIRIEVTKNTGTKAVFKPLIIKSTDWEVFKRSACNALKAGNPKLAKVRCFTLRGEEIFSVNEIKGKQQYVISESGADYIPIALKLTAAEKRALKVQNSEGQGHIGVEEALTDDTVNKWADMPKHKIVKLVERMSNIPTGVTEIIPNFLYLGSLKDAHSHQTVSQLGISHILTIGHDIPYPSHDGISVKFLPVLDVVEQKLSPHFQEAFNLISEVKLKNEKILIHCAVGKSRSPAFILAYLMAKEELDLLTAFTKVGNLREISPNVGFWRELFELELNHFPKNSMNWIHVKTPYANFQEFLEAIQILRGPETHIWWEILQKPKMSLPLERQDEILSEYSKAVMRGEELKLVEYATNSKIFRLHLDIDVKLPENKWTLMEAFEFFVPIILKTVSEEFPENSKIPEISGNTKKTHGNFALTGLLGKQYSFRDLEISWKYGYHVIFQDIECNHEQHKNFMLKLISNLKKVENSNPFFREISENSQWEEVIDLNVDSGFRMLYNHKQFSCKACQKKDNSKKKIKEKSQKKKIEEKKKQCPACNGTGKRDPRVHEFLGIFNSDGTFQVENSNQLRGDLTLEKVRRHMDLATIFVPRSFPVQVEKPAVQVENVPKMIPSHTAIVIDGQDQVKILSMFPGFPDAIPVADHVTLSLGILPENYPVQVEDRVTFKLDAHGVSDTNEALRVKFPGNFPVPGNFPHVTLYHSKFSTPADSNLISTWKPLQVEIEISGTVKEIFRRKPGSFKIQDEIQVENSVGELAVIEFLRKFGENSLVKRFNLKSKKHSEFPNLVQFSYSQAVCDFSEQIVQECRGIILDSKNHWQVVAFPYTKFFNLKEKYAAEIDWGTAVVSEKVDGSIAVLYNYKDKWQVSSSSVPDGSSEFCSGMDFSDFFWEIWEKLGYRLPEEKHLTYIFEILSPRKPIVVKPDRETLILHGIRDNKTYEEQDPRVTAGKYAWECVKLYALTNLPEVNDAVFKLNPWQNEGFVVRDAEFRRVKIKSPQYVALSHLNLKSTLKLNAKHMLKIVRANESSEFLAHFPEYRNLYEAVSVAYSNLMFKLKSLCRGEAKYAKEEGVLKLSDKMRQSQEEDVKLFLQSFEDVELLFDLLQLKIEEAY